MQHGGEGLWHLPAARQERVLAAGSGTAGLSDSLNYGVEITVRSCNHIERPRPPMTAEEKGCTSRVGCIILPC
jgi:hypothetical protein